MSEFEPFDEVSRFEEPEDLIDELDSIDQLSDPLQPLPETFEVFPPEDLTLISEVVDQLNFEGFGEQTVIKPNIPLYMRQAETIIKNGFGNSQDTLNDVA